MLSRVYFAIRQHTWLECDDEVSKKRDPDFEREYAEEFATLKSGELGKKFTHLAAFDEVLGIMKSGNFYSPPDSLSWFVGSGLSNSSHRTVCAACGIAVW
jgi:hypothetical protein